MSGIRLTKTDLRNIEDETLMLVGDAPTLDTLKDEGYTENTTLIRLLDWIGDMGRLVTLLIAQVVQSVGAVVIAIVAGILEYERVRHGALALGQTAEGAVLIGVFVVSANFILPIYALRAMAGHTQVIANQNTLRGSAESFWLWIWGKPTTKTVDAYHNPRLHWAGMVITWSTILLALYDVLSPLITQLATGVATRPTLLLISELVAGVGLSVGGVYFLQSASHEIGVSVVTNQPKRLAGVLENRRLDWEAQRNATRELVRERYMRAKAQEVAKAQSNPLSVNTTPSGKNPPTGDDPKSIPTAVKPSGLQWNDIASANDMKMSPKE
mgnify:CR=1 FL=1